MTEQPPPEGPRPEGAEPSDDRVLTRPFVTVVCAGFFSFSALGVFLPVLPRYVERRLGGGDIAVGVAVGAMAVGAVILRPLAGRIGDRFGRKVLMVGGAALLASMAAIAGLVEALPWLIGTRVLLGLGEAAFFIGATTMATDLAPEDRRGEAVSYFSVAVWGGLAVGPVIGEMVLDHSHYARVWITGAALALFAALISATMKETRTVHASGDLERGRLIHPAALRPGVLLAASVVGTVGFGVFLPLYGPEVGIDDVGLVFLVNGVMVLSIRIFGARLPDRLGPVRAGSIASSTTAVALGTIALWHSATGVYVGAILLAVGAAFGYPAFLVLALRDVPESQRGSVVGTFSAFFDFASGTAGLLLGGIAAATNYRGAFATAAVFALAAFVLLRSGFVGDRHAPVTSPTPVDPALLEPPIPP